MSPSYCISGFLKSDIYPYDPRVISKEKLLQLPSASSLYLPDNRSNSNDSSSLSFNISFSNYRSVIRLSSCLNISLSGKNIIRTFALLLVTFFRTNFIKEQYIVNSIKFSYAFYYYNRSTLFKHAVNKSLENVILSSDC